MLDLVAPYKSVVLHIVDVLLVAFIIYRGLLIIRGTRAVPMLTGLTILVALYFLSMRVGFLTLSWLLGNFLSSIILVVVVLFQDEIRRGLTKVGMQPLRRKNHSSSLGKTIEDVSLVCARFSKQRLGALIVLQREVGLDQFIEEGTPLDAELNRKLLYSLFVKESVLHDGAVVIEGGRVKAAGCLLPLSTNPDLDPNLGTRHRAALGLSEQSDALAIVVSEQNGSISLAREGRLTQNLDPTMLRDLLYRLLETAPYIADPEEEAPR